MHKLFETDFMSKAGERKSDASGKITYQGHEVEIIDTFEMGGHELACIEAVSGKPFVGRCKAGHWSYPRTAFKTVRMEALGVAGEMDWDLCYAVGQRLGIPVEKFVPPERWEEYVAEIRAALKK